MTAAADSGSAAECRWCGNAHAIGELCRARKVSRRLFCFALGAAAVAAGLPGGGAAIPDPWNQKVSVGGAKGTLWIRGLDGQDRYLCDIYDVKMTRNGPTFVTAPGRRHEFAKQPVGTTLVVSDIGYTSTRMEFPLYFNGRT